MAKDRLSMRNFK